MLRSHLPYKKTCPVRATQDDFCKFEWEMATLVAVTGSTWLLRGLCSCLWSLHSRSFPRENWCCIALLWERFTWRCNHAVRVLDMVFGLGRIMVGVKLSIIVNHWSNCCQSKCHESFIGWKIFYSDEWCNFRLYFINSYDLSQVCLMHGWPLSYDWHQPYD